MAAGRIDLSWTASTDTVGVAGYNVYRDGTKINTAPIGSTSYSDTGLAAGANHTYTISALDAAGNESAQSTTYTGAAASGAVTTTYTYDPENRLTQLQTGSTVLGTYAYDGAGDRISKTVGATTAYTLDLASSLPQVLSETTGSTTSAYAYGAGPLEIDQAGTTYWYLTDTLGSVRLLTDSAGATPATYAYSAFGSTRTTSGSIANEVRFTGERTDTESGLEFLRARTYDPATGTFLQRDSWGITPTNSQSIDAYLYTANDPANSTDPSGHMRDKRDDGHIGQCGPSAYTAPVPDATGLVGPPAPTKASSVADLSFTLDYVDWTGTAFGDTDGQHRQATITLSPGTSNFKKPKDFIAMREAAITNVPGARQKYDAYMMTNGPYALYVLTHMSSDDPNWAYGEDVYDTALAYVHNDFGYGRDTFPAGPTRTCWDTTKYYFPSVSLPYINMDPNQGGDLSGSNSVTDVVTDILTSSQWTHPVDFTSDPGPNLNISVSPVGVTWLNGAQP